MGDGDFSFLNTGQEDNGFYAAGAATKPKGPSFTPMSEDTGESEGMGQSPGQTPDAQGEFQRKRAKAADFAKSETLKGLDRLNAKWQANAQASTSAEFGVGDVKPFDYEGTKQRILASPPEGYAKALEAAAAPHGLDNDDVLRGPEDAVTNYKRLTMQEQPQMQQQLQGQLAQQDVPAIKAQLAGLDQTIEKTKQDKLIASTGRQENRLKNDLQFYESQKRQLQARLPQEPATPGEIQDKDVTIDDALTAAGHPRQDAIQSLTEMRRMVEMAGISPSDRVTPLSFIPTYTNLISHIFNPQVRDKMLAELGPPPEKEQEEPERGPQKSTFGSDKLEQDPRFLHNQQMIQQKENRQQQIMTELANSHTFKNVGDVLGFVLTSFLLGPKVASLFFSNMLHNGNLRDELNRLDHETTGLYHQQNSYIQLAQHARSMAASEQHGMAMEAENERHHRSMEMYYQMKMAPKAGWSPEDKEIDKRLQHAYRFQSGNMDAQKQKVGSMEKVLDRGPIDPDFKAVQGAVGKERQKLIQMQNDFAGWKAKVAEWYRQHGVGDIEPSPQVKGDSFTLPNE